MSWGQSARLAAEVAALREDVASLKATFDELRTVVAVPSVVSIPQNPAVAIVARMYEACATAETPADRRRLEDLIDRQMPRLLALAQLTAGVVPQGASESRDLAALPPVRRIAPSMPLGTRRRDTLAAQAQERTAHDLATRRAPETPAELARASLVGEEGIG